MRDFMIDKIEEYLNSIDLKLLSMEELEHYTNILIAIEKRRLEEIEFKQIVESLKAKNPVLI